MRSHRGSVSSLISRHSRSIFFFDGVVPMYTLPVFGE